MFSEYTQREIGKLLARKRDLHSKKEIHYRISYCFNTRHNIIEFKVTVLIINQNSFNSKLYSI